MRNYQLKSVVLLLILSVLSDRSIAGVSQLLHETQFDNCAIKITHVAVPGSKGTSDIRAFNSENSRCTVEKHQVSDALNNALKQYKSLGGFPEIESIFLGRLFVTYTWMSKYLALMSSTDNRWDAKLGKPINMSINKYVNSVLFSSEILEPFSVALRHFGYRIISVSCEKILLNEEKFPYDGMCWISIE